MYLLDETHLYTGFEFRVLFAARAISTTFGSGACFQTFDSIECNVFPPRFESEFVFTAIDDDVPAADDDDFPPLFELCLLFPAAVDDEFFVAGFDDFQPTFEFPTALPVDDNDGLFFFVL